MVDDSRGSSLFSPHLGRLRWVWVRDPVYFITTCTDGRRRVLDQLALVECLQAEWRLAETRHGWRVGRYVVMPDHVHFFAAPVAGARALEKFVGNWKEWTAKAVLLRIREAPPFWQRRFFDHVLRSRQSYAEKWDYVRNNPVRAGLVATPEEWPYAGHVHFDDPL
jgi:REP element-mobilizing transposase RayT